jgi:hypothetical protein
VQRACGVCAPPGSDTGGVAFATPTTDTREIAMNTGSESTAAVRPITSGSLDGTGAGDHDAPYCFGRRPSAGAPYPFSTRQYARLLVLRGRVREIPAKPGPLAPWTARSARDRSARAGCARAWTGHARPSASPHLRVRVHPLVRGHLTGDPSMSASTTFSQLAPQAVARWSGGPLLLDGGPAFAAAALERAAAALEQR